LSEGQGLASIKKKLFLIWYFILLAVCGWALYEFFYPNIMVSLGSVLLLGAAFAVTLVAAITIVLYQRRRKFSIRTIFAVLIILAAILTGLLASPAYACVQNKAKTQWYINDLQTQGFNVVYHTRVPYEGAATNHLDSYSAVASTAGSINATSISVIGGAPLWFVFFVPSGIEITFGTQDSGYYSYYAQN
jgi:hypothetical protein